MMRHNYAPTASHKALQTKCMLLLLLGVGAVFVYPLMHLDAGTAAQSQSKHSGNAVSLGAPVP